MDTAAAHLGIYRRVIRASLDRVWENVLDWEHLPHLHKESFRAIAPIRVDRDGWRANVELADGGVRVERLVEGGRERLWADPRGRFRRERVRGDGESDADVWDGDG